MELLVFNIYTDGKNEEINTHILIPKNKGVDFAIEHGKKFLKSIGEEKAILTDQECRFCYSEQADESQQQEVENQGYAIRKQGGGC